MIHSGHFSTLRRNKSFYNIPHFNCKFTGHLSSPSQVSINLTGFHKSLINQSRNETCQVFYIVL
jgi:hypothetical protein